MPTYERHLLNVCLYPRGAEGWEKLQRRPLITNPPLCVKFETELMGINAQWILNLILLFEMGQLLSLFTPNWNPSGPLWPSFSFS